MERNNQERFIKGSEVSNYEQNIVGQRFGRLVVTGEAPPKIQPSGQKKRQVYCNCDCGNQHIAVRLELLKNGKTKSCGCFRKENSCNIHKKSFNNYQVCENYIVIYGNDNTEQCLIDKEDLQKVNLYHWFKDKQSKYWCADVNGVRVHIHLLIVGKWYDHINGNVDDNRKANLRKCTNQQNSWNTVKHKDNLSGYKGVYRRYNKGKYIAHITKDGVSETIGRFNTAEEAAHAYDQRAKELFGNWARLNFS